MDVFDFPGSTQAGGLKGSLFSKNRKRRENIMLPTFIAITVIVAVIVLWTISTQRKLVVLDENISNSMSQIGVQLSSRFDALTALLDLTKAYAKHESETLIETIKSRRSVITAKSTPDDVLRQEGVISEALGRIAMVTEQYPELKANQTYIKTMDAVETFENMVRTSRLIYNDSVTKLNREIRMFPISMIAGMLGFQQREYLVEQAGKADMPSMK
ncbi:LemA family protein [Desulfonispora thiosulfatigenes]